MGGNEKVVDDKSRSKGAKHVIRCEDVRILATSQFGNKKPGGHYLQNLQMLSPNDSVDGTFL